MGVVDGSQFQIVIGNNVVEVYDTLLKICPLSGNQGIEAKKDDRKCGAKLLEFIISVFQPLVPAIAGAGVLKSVLLLLSMFGLLANDSTVYTALAAISDATFYFLPIMVAVTTANALKSNRLVAVAAVGYLLLPATTQALTDGMTLFGSTAQGNVVDMMDQLGFYTGVNEYLYEGATPFTNNLMLSLIHI